MNAGDNQDCVALAKYLEYCRGSGYENGRATALTFFLYFALVESQEEGVVGE